jgi:hypothetical protein
MCAIRHSATKMFSRDIFSPIVNSSHDPMIFVSHGALSEESSPFTDSVISISAVFLKIVHCALI